MDRPATLKLLESAAYAAPISTRVLAPAALSSARWRQMGTAGQHSHQPPRKAPTAMVNFHSESELLGKIRCSDRSIFCFVTPHNPECAASDEFYSDVQRLSSSIIFTGRGVQNSYHALDESWCQSKCEYLNHVGRSDDDQMYGFCQNLCKDLLSKLDLSFDPALDADAKILESQVALSAADTYRNLLRISVMLIERYRSSATDILVIHGSRLEFIVPLSKILEKNGVEVAVFSTPMWKGREVEVDAIFNDPCTKRRVRLKRQDCDLDHESQQVADSLMEDCVAVFTAAKDYVYFSNFTSFLPHTTIKRFTVFSRHVDEDAKRAISNALPEGSECKIHCLSGNFRFLGEDDRTNFVESAVHAYSLFQHTAFNDIQLDRSFQMFGIPALLNNLVETLFYYRVFLRAFSLKRPASVLCLPSRFPAARAAVIAGRTRMIGSAELQCEPILRSRRFWPPNVDLMLACYPASANVYREFFGVSESSIKIVGSPRLDEIVAPYKETRRPAVSDGVRVFLALQTYSVEACITLCKISSDALQEFHSPVLTIGFHPRQSDSDKEQIRVFARTLPGHIEFSAGEGIHRLAQHNIFLTYFSFMAAEAFALGCSVIAVNPTQDVWPLRLSEFLSAREARSADEVRSIIVEILNIEASEKVDGGEPSDIFRDGRSVERIDLAIRSGQSERGTPLGRALNKLRGRGSHSFRWVVGKLPH